MQPRLLVLVLPRKAHVVRHSGIVRNVPPKGSASMSITCLPLLVSRVGVPRWSGCT